MFTSTRNERITQLLNEWYIEIRSRRLQEAQRLKEHTDIQINRLREEKNESMQDQNLLLYYSLLDFTFNYLVDNLNVSKDSFDEIEAFNVPMDNFLSYYYHFFKAIHCDAIGNYMLAKEHYKLKEHEVAAELIEKGLEICNDLQNEGYPHHFKILKALNENIPAEELETIIIKGIAYFDREELYEYKQEYEEKLAIKFYEEDNHKKASSYFYGSTQSKQKSLNKGALK